jgi:hypothetical protein
VIVPFPVPVIGLTLLIQPGALLLTVHVAELTDVVIEADPFPPALLKLKLTGVHITVVADNAIVVDACAPPFTAVPVIVTVDGVDIGVGAV